MKKTANEALPVLLREERFGGLLFSPRDAVHLELDRGEFWEAIRARDIEAAAELSSEPSRFQLERMRASVEEMRERAVREGWHRFDSI